LDILSLLWTDLGDFPLAFPPRMATTDGKRLMADGVRPFAATHPRHAGTRHFSSSFAHVPVFRDGHAPSQIIALKCCFAFCICSHARSPAAWIGEGRCQGSTPVANAQPVGLNCDHETRAAVTEHAAATAPSSLIEGPSAVQDRTLWKVPLLRLTLAGVLLVAASFKIWQLFQDRPPTEGGWLHIAHIQAEIFLAPGCLLASIADLLGRRPCCVFSAVFFLLRRICRLQIHIRGGLV